MTLSGIGTPLPSVGAAINPLLERLYQGIRVPLVPITEKTASKDERNSAICVRYANGETLEAIAACYGISNQRVHQIVCSSQFLLTNTPTRARVLS